MTSMERMSKVEELLPKRVGGWGSTDLQEVIPGIILPMCIYNNHEDEFTKLARRIAPMFLQ